MAEPQHAPPTTGEPAAEHGKDHAGHHGDPLLGYLSVFAALMLLTAVTVWVSFIEFKTWPTAAVTVALIVAVLKATLVVLIFMHVWHSSPLTKIIIFGSILTLMLLLGLTYADYWSRGRTGLGAESPEVRRQYDGP